MRRADRLFRIVQRMRQRGAPAGRGAGGVGADRLSGHPRPARLRRPHPGRRPASGTRSTAYELPLLMFDEEEIEALVLGARIVRAWADKKLARAAEEALQKIETVLPSKLKSRLAESALRDAKRLPQLPAGPDRRAADSRGPVRGRAGADARRLPRASGRRGAGRGEFGRSAALRTSMSDRGHPRLSSRA